MFTVSPLGARSAGNDKLHIISSSDWWGNEICWNNRSSLRVLDAFSKEIESHCMWFPRLASKKMLVLTLLRLTCKEVKLIQSPKYTVVQFV